VKIYIKELYSCVIPAASTFYNRNSTPGEKKKCLYFITLFLTLFICFFRLFFYVLLIFDTYIHIHTYYILYGTVHKLCRHKIGEFLQPPLPPLCHRFLTAKPPHLCFIAFSFHFSYQDDIVYGRPLWYSWIFVEQIFSWIMFLRFTKMHFIRPWLVLKILIWYF